MNLMTLVPTGNQPAPPETLRQQALRLWRMPSFEDKQLALLALDTDQLRVDSGQTLFESTDLPGRPARPALVHPAQLQTRAVGTHEGHAGLIHALTHIEANAINLALDMVWRFSGLPDDFYRDWWHVAREEAQHFGLLKTHLNRLGYSYGDCPAHDGLWDMAVRTSGDVLARLALVPRTLEARGLDATPGVRKKLVSIGDLSGARILDIILLDEIGHVAIGNRWYRYLCQQRQLDSITCYTELAQRFAAPALKRPLNLQARRAAGFSEAELAALVTKPASIQPHPLSAA